MTPTANTGMTKVVQATQLPGFKKTFLKSAVAHALLIGSVFFAERVVDSSRAKPTSIIFIPAVPKGELPQGPSIGIGEAPLGNNPQPAAATPAPAAPNRMMASLAVPQPPPQLSRPTPPAETRRPTATPTTPSARTVPKTTASTTSKTRTTKTAKPPTTSRTVQTQTKGASSQRAASDASSYSEIRQKLMQGMGGSGAGPAGIPNGVAGGTGVGARGTPAGGGNGKGRVGDPRDSDIGVLGGSGPGSPFWDYYLHIHDVMYAAWNQPSEFADPLRPPTARVRLRIAKDGSLWAAELAQSSGVKAVDSSALTAARHARLNPPPDGLLKGRDAVEITVAFKLGGES